MTSHMGVRMCTRPCDLRSDSNNHRDLSMRNQRVFNILPRNSIVGNKARDCRIVGRTLTYTALEDSDFV